MLIVLNCYFWLVVVHCHWVAPHLFLEFTFRCCSCGFISLFDGSVRLTIDMNYDKVERESFKELLELVSDLNY